eukprot:6481817-Amphidinium_carterae.3
MYGTRNASNVRQKTWGRHLQANGFELGSSNPPSFAQNDFVIAWLEENAEACGTLLRQKFEVTLVGLIGRASHLAKLEVLNRYYITCACTPRVKLNAAQGRHAEMVECLARAMAKPREGHMAQLLKRLVRSLKGAPRHSAESEYYALTTGACVAPALQSHLADGKLPAEITLHTDSSSA